jgi:hypothetical protein
MTLALQAASAIIYTIFALFFTFARTGTRGGKDIPPYMFTCPAVQPQFSALLRRHVAFLVVLFAFQTLALTVRPHLPDWWNIGFAERPLMWRCSSCASALDTHRYSLIVPFSTVHIGSWGLRVTPADGNRGVNSRNRCESTGYPAQKQPEFKGL